MDIKFGNGKTEYGPGIQINLTGDELAHSITSYLYSHDIIINGPRTVRVNGEMCQEAEVYVDPSGRVIEKGKGWNGRGYKSGDVEESFEIGKLYTYEGSNDLYTIIHEHNHLQILNVSQNQTWATGHHQRDLSFTGNILNVDDMNKLTEGKAHKFHLRYGS